MTISPLRWRALPALGLASALLLSVSAHAQDAARARDANTESYPARCGAGGGTSGGARYTPLPRGDVFCPLLADPKAIRSFVSYQRGDATDFAADIAAVGIGDQFAFFRVSGGKAGNGLQLGLSGAVFAQFDVNTPSIDLLNADYVIALPLTFRAGAFSLRARIYHQSSHLGDELLLRPEPPERENLSFEAADLIVSVDAGPLRTYAGGEYYVGRDPVTLPEGLLHGGVELRPSSRAGFGALAVVRPVAGVDVKAVNDSSWQVGVSVRAGFEFGQPHEEVSSGRRWSLLGELYNGPSPYGQFQRSKVRLVGLGLHFTL